MLSPTASWLMLLMVFMVAACDQDEHTADVADDGFAVKTGLTRVLGPEHTGINTVNAVVEDTLVNYFRWMYQYNGGGWR